MRNSTDERKKSVEGYTSLRETGSGVMVRGLGEVRGL